jgi:hypothetical protein
MHLKIISKINSDWSLVIGHWSLVIGHWSLVIGHWSLVLSEVVGVVTERSRSAASRRVVLVISK